jgi:hypothetical protein
MIRLRGDKTAVGIIYAGSQEMLFNEIDMHCDPYVCEYKPIWLNIFFNGHKENGCPTFPLVSKEEAKTIEKKYEDEDEPDAFSVAEEREQELWKRSTVNVESNEIHVEHEDDNEEDWENFDDYDWLKRIRENAKKLQKELV